MEIRVLGPEDVERYVAVRTRALEDAPRAFLTSPAEQRSRPRSRVAEQLTPGEGTFVLGAFHGDDLIGTVGSFRDTHARARYKATVWGMYVVPEQRGQGLARALLEACLRRAREDGVEVLVLAVGEDNPRAQGLYERAGFSVFGVEPDAFRVDGEPVTEVHMRHAF